VLTDSGYEAFVWTQADGMQRLIDVLVANGATGLDGWILTEAQAVSADGQWVVGSCTPPGEYPPTRNRTKGDSRNTLAAS
jgi:hypothetical protein